METPDTKQLQKHIGKLVKESLNINSPIQMLYVIREDLNMRGYGYYNKRDILEEFERLQDTMGKLHSEMISINDLLKKITL